MYSYDNALNISCTFHCSCFWLHESKKLKLLTIFSFNKYTVATGVPSCWFDELCTTGRPRTYLTCASQIKTCALYFLCHEINKGEVFRTIELGWKRNIKQNFVTKTAPAETGLCNICRFNNYIKIKIAVCPDVKPYGLVDTIVLEGPALLFHMEDGSSSSLPIIGTYLPNNRA